MQTYLFYDIETTGLNKAFDQALHFAAIRTDLNLVEQERYDIKIKLNPDIIPAPAALITHYIGIKEALQGTPEMIAIKRIHELLNTPGTISVGYNTLGFDDEFLRFSFYRNLLAPYTHQFANQCSRMDIYPMAIMYFLFKNDVIQWPKRGEKNSFKLEDINQLNQFISGRSHHAMVDVEVTLALAQQFFKERKMWDYLTDYFNKQTDEKRSHNLTDKVGLMVYGKLGADKRYQAPVLFLGNHRHYKNQTLWLRLDLENLTLTTAESIPETTWVIRKKLAEPGFILPFEAKYLKHLSPEQLALAESNKQWLLQHPEIYQKITNYHTEYKYPVIPETDIEASLYMNGFWSQDDERFCRQFHAASAQERAHLTENVRNPQLKKLAARLLGRYSPEVLTLDEAEDFADYMRRVKSSNDDRHIVDFRGEKRLTPQAALLQIAQLRAENALNDTQIGLLDDLEEYLTREFVSKK